MSDTMSSPSTDWAQFYQHTNPAPKPPTLFTTNQISDTTTVTTTTIGSTNGGLRPEGGISKPVRRRSRASRRTPTTLLNTDTANFRAMVQQFTGGPLAPFAAGSSNTGLYSSGMTNFGFGLGTGQQMVNPNAGMIPRSGYNMLQLQQHQQQQLQPRQHQQQHQFMFPLNNMNEDDHHAYIQRLERSRIPPTADVSGGGSFGVDGFSSSGSGVVIRSNSSSSKNISEDNYML